MLVDKNLQPLKQKNGDLMEPLVDSLDKRTKIKIDM